MNDFLKTTLFIDLETVAVADNYNDLSLDYKKLWEKQCNTSYSYLSDKGKTIDILWKEKAALHPEFARIVSVSLGYLSEENEKYTLKIKSFFDDNEKTLIEKVCSILNRLDSNKSLVYRRLCSHNGKKFDFPFLFKRMIINSITVPDVLNLIGKKPWETENIDTMEIWNSSGTGYPSQDLLCHLFNIPKKTVLDGSRVHDTYYKEKDIKKIVEYCGLDVVALVKIFLRIYEVQIELNNVIIL